MSEFAIGRGGIPRIFSFVEFARDDWLTYPRLGAGRARVQGQLVRGAGGEVGLAGYAEWGNGYAMVTDQVTLSTPPLGVLAAATLTPDGSPPDPVLLSANNEPV